MKATLKIVLSHPAFRLAAIALLLFAVASLAAHACPNCGLDVIEEQKGGAGLKEGFTYSIICLAGMPFAVFAGAAGMIFRAYRKGHAAEDQL
ncbi:MAG: hypothetical protein JWQ98_2807 [Chlorobi bacterium]|jgi:hypothetical protein|nr:hypothetical protein [Chlorobiota bacterium]